MDKVGSQTLKVMKKANWYNNWLFERIKPSLKGNILEIGSGIGNFTHKLATAGDVTATDVDKAYIQELRKKKFPTGLVDIEKGKYSFKNKEFNSLVCMNVLEHIKDDKKALKNMYNLLTPGGNLILLVPAHQIAFSRLDKNLGHFRRYSKKELKIKLEKTGFRITKLEYLNWLGLVGWYINGRILQKEILPSTQVGIFDKISRPFLSVEKYIMPPFGLSILAIAEK